MEIKRKNMNSIIKEKVKDELYINYSLKQLIQAEDFLRKNITECTLNSFDLISLMRKYYKGNAKEDIYDIPKGELEKTRFNCYYQTKRLKSDLESIGMHPYVMTYKADKFSTLFGDECIKEAHMSLIVPYLDNEGSKKIIIYDPGLKIDRAIYIGNDDLLCCSASGNKVLIKHLEDKRYPYCVELKGINKYSYNKKEHEVLQKFNPFYYTLNYDEVMLPYAFLFLLGYKATTFSLDSKKRSSITLKPLEEVVNIYDEERCEQKILTYDDILKIGNKGLKNILGNTCEKLDLDSEEMVKDIMFMIEIKENFNNMMCEKVIKEALGNQKTLIKKL